MSGISVFNAAVRQLQSQTNNLRKVNEAKAKAEQDKDLFDFKIKKAKIELEDAKRSGRLTDLEINRYEAQIKEEKKTVDNILKAQESLRSIAQQKQVDGINQARKELQAATQYISSQHPLETKRDILLERKKQLESQHGKLYPKSLSSGRPVFATRDYSKDIFAINQELADVEYQIKNKISDIQKEIETRQEKKVKAETSIDSMLNKAEAGEISYEDVRKKYPSKSTEIKEAQINSLDEGTKLAVNEIKGVLESYGELEGEKLTGTARANKMYSILKQIVDNEATARSNGVNVDAILELFDVSRSDLATVETPAKKNKILQGIKDILKAMVEN